MDVDLSIKLDFNSIKTERQTSYGHNRKKGVNALSDIFNLPFQTLIFRCGWAAKNIHSAFDYIFNSMEKDDACAHALADWKEVNKVYMF